jgi:hypothetical protein
VGKRRLIDLDEDLLDAEQAAAHIGLDRGSSFHVYVLRFPDELTPAVVRGQRIRLWLRQDLDAFLKRHPGIGRKARDADAAPS